MQYSSRRYVFTLSVSKWLQLDYYNANAHKLLLSAINRSVRWRWNHIITYSEHVRKTMAEDGNKYEADTFTYTKRATFLDVQSWYMQDAYQRKHL